MKKIYFLFIFVLIACQLKAQEDTTGLRETAIAFMKQGDYASSTILFTKILEYLPGDIEITRHLAFSYYKQQDYTKALTTITPLLSLDNQGVETYLLAANIYKAMDLPAEQKNIFKIAVKKFPENGALYNSLGEILWAQKDYDAIKQWEKGIKKDPSYTLNYYSAARFYFEDNENILSILYGEIFINMDPVNIKTIEIKEMLPICYQRIFEGTGKEQNSKNDLVKEVLRTYNKQAEIAARGINTETLAKIRIRFILDWFNSNPSPYKLFQYQRKLLQEGLYDAYNQWLFGAVPNLVNFQKWVQDHSTEYNLFTEYQKEHTF